MVPHLTVAYRPHRRKVPMQVAAPDQRTHLVRKPGFQHLLEPPLDVPVKRLASGFQRQL